MELTLRVLRCRTSLNTTIAYAVPKVDVQAETLVVSGSTA